MSTIEKTTVTVTTTVKASVEKVWDCFINPKHITQWCYASDDWHAPYADNDLRVGGKFTTTMAAKDGSVSFDFGGTYTVVELHKQINYSINGDGRKVQIIFEGNGNETTVTESFETETENPVEMQRGGWQSILNSFKKHVEQSSK